MKREIKTALTKQKILESAFHVFANAGYKAASMQDIANDADISKGIIYHYFKDKNDLYLTCAGIVFNELADVLGKTGDGGIDAYFSARSAWFASNPDKAAMFCEVLLFYPQELQEKMQKCRQRYDEANRCVLKAVLAGKQLRNGYQEEDVQRIFEAFQNFLNAQYRRSLIAHDTRAIVQHDKDSRAVLQIFLYGIVDEKR
ncbi:MAG: TetR/AcrR family transcriptional regulator [Lactimicrobium sp.]|jgi:TetR/AcrR family transcriptional regulator|uniref:TetR/AcrR family transcriptional regulator n=1 Tax=Lactimicrobium sp. TaxID=2563780 RepID=UPI002F352C8A